MSLKYELASPYELIFYFILGGIAGLVSFAFIKSLYFAEDVFDNKTRLPEYIKPAIGGIIMGLVALLYPEIMGVGYETINLALKGEMLWYIAFILIFVKIFATSITLGSGGSGGIFAPSLFMGAMLGYFFGSFVHQYFPLITASPNAYALVAMGGLVAGTTRAPITAIIIVFELTNDYRIILPLMITCIISTILSSRLSRESIYTLKLLLRNISIKEGTEANVMETIFVNDVYTEEFNSILETDNFSQVINKIIKGKGPDFPVVDKNNNIKGMISLKDLKEYLYERESLQNLLIAGDVANFNFDMINVQDNCKSAMDIMSKYDFEGLPVSDRGNLNKVIGMIWRKDIQDAYQKAIEAREITSSLASSIVMKDDLPQVHFMEGYSISEISAPNTFINKSIRELDIRARYGVEVLSIKTIKNKSEIIKAIPSADYIIRKDDVLVVAGEIRNINVLQNVD